VTEGAAGTEEFQVGDLGRERGADGFEFRRQELVLCYDSFKVGAQSSAVGGFGEFHGLCRGGDLDLQISANGGHSPTVALAFNRDPDSRSWQPALAAQGTLRLRSGGGLQLPDDPLDAPVAPAHISGQRLDLDFGEGNLGSATQWLRLDSGRSDALTGGFSLHLGGDDDAQAWISETSGDLRLLRPLDASRDEAISLAGTLHLRVTEGDLLNATGLVQQTVDPVGGGQVPSKLSGQILSPRPLAFAKHFVQLREHRILQADDELSVQYSL
jgi:hypothetical protein